MFSITRHVVLVDLDELFRGHFLDVSARSEGPVAARDHNRANGCIGVQLSCGDVDFINEGTVQCVQRLGPI